MMYMTLDEARQISVETFKLGMKRWEEYCKKNLMKSHVNSSVRPLTSDIICWRKMGFQRAGVCSYVKRVGITQITIEMNINYLSSKDARKFAELTMLHELAHALAYVFNGSFGHNKTWKAICKIIGGSGERCHEYATPENQPIKKSQKKTFVCPVCGETHTLSPLLQRRAKTGKYLCAKCNTNLKVFVK